MKTLIFSGKIVAFCFFVSVRIFCYRFFPICYLLLQRLRLDPFVGLAAAVLAVLVFILLTLFDVQP